MTKDEALRMAIEALETAEIQSEYDGLSNLIFKAIQACKEALEQPAQEPVAWIIQTQKIDGKPTEPYAMMGKYKYVADTCDFGEPIPLYTHPAPSWQGLSDDELDALNGSPMALEYSGLYKFARAIEQALKEKNT